MIETIEVLVRAEGEGAVGDARMQISKQCAECKHWDGVVACKAFPEGIPDAIFEGKHDHTEAFPGDGGVRFTA